VSVNQVVAIIPGLDAQLPTRSASLLASLFVMRSLHDHKVPISNYRMSKYKVPVQSDISYGFRNTCAEPARLGLCRCREKRPQVSVCDSTPGTARPPAQTQVLQAHDIDPRRRNTTLPVVFVGDFNAIPGSPPITNLSVPVSRTLGHLSDLAIRGLPVVRIQQ